LQRDVADYLGIDRGTYKSYEDNNRDYYPLDKLLKIADLFKVDITDLLDDYNRFLFEGQGNKTKALRKEMELTQSDFGKQLGVSAKTVRQWELEGVRMFKGTWETIFKGLQI